MLRKLFSVLVLSTLSASLMADPIPGIGPVGKVEKAQGGFAFTEGPAADNAGNLYFTDIPNEEIHKLTPEGKHSTFVEKSNHANGLMFDGQGRLIACEMDGRLAAYSPSGKRVILAEGYKGNRFNAPNDLVVDSHGGIYFTDPTFRAPMPLPQGKAAVYYLNAKGEVTRLLDNLPNPNGVILSTDEKTLYVIPTGQAEMMSYPVESQGKIGAGKVFATLDQPKGKKGGGGDGLTIDTKGNLYITSAMGIQVFSKEGEKLGLLVFPEQPSNCTFAGPDRKTLFVTARTSLYKVRLEAQGHTFPGKP
ncbi:MAG: SMP-30/gluconolactonase/LRE family protein [Gemmataceae bacterium]|nr:SMP-30/gluconolactonase/LRE family protein [Gemmataceae bacterium]